MGRNFFMPIFNFENFKRVGVVAMVGGITLAPYLEGDFRKFADNFNEGVVSIIPFLNNSAGSVIVSPLGSHELTGYSLWIDHKAER